MATIVPFRTALLLALCWAVFLKQKTKIDGVIYFFLYTKAKWISRCLQFSNVVVTVILLRLLISHPRLHYGRYGNAAAFVGICTIYLLSMMITFAAQKTLKEKKKQEK